MAKRLKWFYSLEARDAYEAGCEEKNRYKAAKWFSISERIDKANEPSSFPPPLFPIPPLISSTKFNPWHKKG